MAARVAGVPMPSASVRIFLTAGSRTNFATPHMAAMSDASLKGFGGRVRLLVTVTSSAVTASPSRSAGKGAVDSFSFSAAVGSPSVESSSVCGLARAPSSQGENLPPARGEALTGDLELERASGETRAAGRTAPGTGGKRARRRRARRQSAARGAPEPAAGVGMMPWCAPTFVSFHALERRVRSALAIAGPKAGA